MAWPGRLLHPPCQAPRAASGNSSAASAGGALDLARGAQDTAAVYLRRPLAAGDSEHHERSVVVLGGVPAGCTITSGGDIVVMGVLEGAAMAGQGGNREAMVVPLAVGPRARISIAGVAAPVDAASAACMAVLEPGATAVTWKPMPGAAALAAAQPAAARALPSLPLDKLGSAAVLALGVGLALAPATVLGGLLHSGAETTTAALLECVVYGYILLQGAGLLGDGSELLLEILNPGIVGGVVLPLLGAMPDALIILNSGLNATPEQAKEEIAVGIGTLAGSTILLLSIAWGGSILVGRNDLDPVTGEAIDKTRTPGREWDLQRTGVTVDGDVRKGALVMAGSVLLYGTVQVPAILGDTEDPQAAMLGAVACLVACVAYCGYSVLSPELQKRRIDAARKARFRSYALRALALKTDGDEYGGLLAAGGGVNPLAVDRLFAEFDRDASGKIDTRELEGLLMGLQLSAGGAVALEQQDSLAMLTREFDLDSDQGVSRQEFGQVLDKWVAEKLAGAGKVAAGGMLARRASLRSLASDPAALRALLVEGAEEDLAALQDTAAALEAEGAEEAAEDLEEEAGEAGAPVSRGGIALQASLKLGAGVGLCAIFSDPLVEALTNLSHSTGIPPFFVGFVLTPLASNASEFLSSLRFASKRRRKNASLTFSQIYGSVTINNTFVLGLFLAVVSLQKIEWVYSSEVAVIGGATLAVGALGYSRSTFATAWALPVIALYPLSLVVVQVLDTYLGWQ